MRNTLKSCNNSKSKSKSPPQQMKRKLNSLSSKKLTKSLKSSNLPQMTNLKISSPTKIKQMLNDKKPKFLIKSIKSSKNLHQKFLRQQRKTTTTNALYKSRKIRPTYFRGEMTNPENSLVKSKQNIKQSWKENLISIITEFSNIQSPINNSSEPIQMTYDHSTSLKNKNGDSFLKYALQQKKIFENSELIGLVRIQVVDWLYLIGSQLLLKRQTVQLAICYLDVFMRNENFIQKNTYLIASGSLLLSVKQEERENQQIVIRSLTNFSNIQIRKQQIIEIQKQMLICLNFRLKFNTMAFWIDYFSMKWDIFVQKILNFFSIQPSSDFSYFNLEKIILLRDPKGNSYKFYRQACEITDVLLLFSETHQYQYSKLALACLYLIIRIQCETNYTNKEDKNVWNYYYTQFKKRASPIFKDPYRINELFNQYLTQLCQFQITEIIPSIKYISKFINLPFSFTIDERAYNQVTHFQYQSKNYEDFIRYMTYSHTMKNYAKNVLN